MPCIRRKYHYGLVYLSPEIKFGKIPLCGQTVEVVEGSEPTIKKFTGFSDIKHVVQFGGSIITGITGFTTGEAIFGPWQELNASMWLLGSKDTDGVKLVIYDDSPIVILEKECQSPLPQKRDNISHLF